MMAQLPTATPMNDKPRLEAGSVSVLPTVVRLSSSLLSTPREETKQI
jgi:hypothetical protein